MGKINTGITGYKQPDPPKNSVVYFLKKIYEALCCLSEKKQTETNASPLCYQDENGNCGYIETINCEDGEFLEYRFHSTQLPEPVVLTTLTSLTKCPTLYCEDAC